MSVREAANLVIKGALLAKGGEVFITKMPVVRIIDLARVMIDILAPRFGKKSEDIEIRYIGAKPGEKLYEELMSEEETNRSYELKDMFVTLPAHRFMYKDVEHTYPDLVQEAVDRAYVSSTEPLMNVEEIQQFLDGSGLLGQCVEKLGI